MKAVKIYYLAPIFFIFACTTPKNEASHGTNESLSTAPEDSTAYPDCFSDIDTSMIEQGLGCGSIFLYKVTQSGIITVSIDPDQIPLSNRCRKFELIDGIDINLEIYPSEDVHKDSVRNIDYCKCVKIANAQKRISLNAESGHIVAAVGANSDEKSYLEKITVKLDSLRFTSPITKETIEFEDILIWNANIGWITG